jgi:hypothetical protein
MIQKTVLTAAPKAPATTLGLMSLMVVPYLIRSFLRSRMIQPYQKILALLPVEPYNVVYPDTATSRLPQFVVNYNP